MVQKKKNKEILTLKDSNGIVMVTEDRFCDHQSYHHCEVDIKFNSERLINIPYYGPQFRIPRYKNKV